jgi:hypothetical protein
VPQGAFPPPPPFSGPPSRRLAWLIPVLVVGVVIVLCLVGVVTYLVVRDEDATEGGPAQLRRPVSFAPVRSSAPGPCGPGTLEDETDGQCLQVGSGMTIHRVEDIRVQPPGGASGSTGFTVAMTFTSQDSQAFATLTAAAAQQQPPANRIAIVAEGRLLSAPTVSAAITGGKVEISGPSSRFTRDYTENLVRRITGE